MAQRHEHLFFFLFPFLFAFCMYIYIFVDLIVDYTRFNIKSKSAGLGWCVKWGGGQSLWNMSLQWGVQMRPPSPRLWLVEVQSPARKTLPLLQQVSPVKPEYSNVAAPCWRSKEHRLITAKVFQPMYKRVCWMALDCSKCYLIMQG